ncbi:MAG TPA: hypothetical protein VF704_02920 [Allosphingosinicella sp.]|jgi:hypothetical protein
MSYYLKDPQSRVDYGIDWTAFLDGATVAASVWTVTPQEPGGIGVEAADFTGTRTAATLAGGKVGRVYTVTNQVTLTDGHCEERSITLRVEQR